MSIRDQEGLKTVLARLEPQDLWKAIDDSYAHVRPERWKQVAMLTLRHVAHWPIEEIGYAFGHSPGHVCRTLKLVQKELAETLDPGWEDWLRLRESSPDLLDPDEQTDPLHPPALNDRWGRPYSQEEHHAA